MGIFVRRIKTFKPPNSFQAQLFFFFGSFFIFTGVMSLITFTLLSESLKSNLEVQHSYKVLQATNSYVERLHSAESMVRGYLITKDEYFLPNPQELNQQIDKSLQHLQSITPTQSQTKKVARLVELTAARKKRLEIAIKKRQTGEYKEVIEIISDRVGESLSREIDKVADDIRLEETRALATEDQQTRLLDTLARLVIASKNMSVFAALFAAYLFISNEVRRRRETELALSEANRKLGILLNEAGSTIESYIATNEEKSELLESLTRRIKSERG